MARRSSTTGPVYVWDEYPDDPTLGGAIPAALFEQLQRGDQGDEPDAAPDASS